MAICDTNELFKQLKKIIKLPDNVIELKMHLVLNETPMIEIKSYVEKNDYKDNFHATITQKFEIKLIE